MEVMKGYAWSLVYSSDVISGSWNTDRVKRVWGLRIPGLGLLAEDLVLTILSSGFPRGLGMGPGPTHWSLIVWAQGCSVQGVRSTF